VRENRQWKPAISYCRYADDFVIVVKGTRKHAEAVREACRAFLEGELKLTLNMEKTHITHVMTASFSSVIASSVRRGPCGRMWPVTTIPWEKYRGFAERLVKQLSADFSMNRMDMIESLNRQLAGWAAFYQYTDYTATVFRKVDRTVFWKLGYWLARKYRRSFTSLMRDLVRVSRGRTCQDMGAERTEQSGVLWRTRAWATRHQPQGAFHLAHTIREPVHPAR